MVQDHFSPAFDCLLLYKLSPEPQEGEQKIVVPGVCEELAVRTTEEGKWEGTSQDRSQCLSIRVQKKQWT